MLQGSGVIVFSQLAIVDSCSIEADCRTHVWLKSGTKRKVPADTEACGSQLSRRDHFMLCQKIQNRAAVAVELSDGRLRGILQSPRASWIVEGNRRTRRFDSVIDLRSCNDKAISCKAHTCA